MTTPFQNLRTKLRDAGCRVECGDQFKTTHGSMVELMLVYPEGGGFVRCLVIDERDEGYAMFIENQTIAIDADVQAILIAGLQGLPKLEKVG